MYADWEIVVASWAVETDDAFRLQRIGVAETLLRVGFDGAIEPFLATSWERSDDLNWDFTLREGVTFHDGTALTAEHVVSSLTHLLGVEAPARSFNPRNIAGVEAISDNVVRITTVEPTVLGPMFAASPNGLILAPRAYQGDRIDPTRAGTGPFVMTAQNLPQSVTLERNDNYWGGPVALAGIDVRYILDGGTRATLIQTGEADIVRNMPIPQLPLLEADPNVMVVYGPIHRTNSLYLNNQREPFTDVRVRQAIQAAIDIDAIAEAVLEGAVIPAIGPFSPTAAWAPPGAQPISRDLDRARALLAEAGIEPGQLNLSLWAYPGRVELPDVAVAIQAMLGEVGISVDVRVAEYAALEPDVLAGNFDMMLLSRGYLVDINDPIGYLRSDYTCAGSFNLSHFCDPAIDDQITALLSEDELEARWAGYSQIAQRLQDEAITIYLYHPQQIHAHRPHIQNFLLHPLEHRALIAELSSTE